MTKVDGLIVSLRMAHPGYREGRKDRPQERQEPVDLEGIDGVRRLLVRPIESTVSTSKSAAMDKKSSQLSVGVPRLDKNSMVATIQFGHDDVNQERFSAPTT